MPEPRGIHVLVVDDEPQVAAVIKMILTRAGFAVRTVGNSTEALDLVRLSSEPLDLLISDVKIPGIDGCELVMRVRAFRPDLAVILTSGFAREQQVRGIPFLPKPFNKEQLLAAVDGALRPESRPRTFVARA